MNVLTISVSSEGHGAYGRHRRMAAALHAAGHRVYWMAPGLRRPGAAKLLTIPPAKGPSGGYWGWRRRLLTAFAQHAPTLARMDAILTIREYDAAPCLESPLLKRLPHVLFLRGDSMENERYNLRHPVSPRDLLRRPINLLLIPRVRRRIFASLDRVVVQGEFLAKKLAREHHGPLPPVEILTNDCNIEWQHDEQPESTHGDALRSFRRPGLPLIGMVALAYWHAKGYGVLLKSLRRMPPSQRPCTVLMGYGPDQERIKRYISAHGLTDRVLFMGKVPQAHRLMKDLDLLVVPTHKYDFCPNVVLEAISAGLPVIASDIEAHHHLLGPKSGCLFPSGDPAALAAMLREVPGNPQRLRALREHIQKRQEFFSFDWDQKVVEIVESLTGEKPQLTEPPERAPAT